LAMELPEYSSQAGVYSFAPGIQYLGI